MNLASGELDDNVYQLINATHGKYGTLYLTAIDNYVETLQAAAITNKTILKEFFPNCKAFGTIYKTISNVNTTYETPDMEEDLASEIANIARCM